MHERTMRTMPREGFAIAWLQAPPVFTHATILYEALQAWNRGRLKRLNIPPHRRMVALIKAPPLLLRRGFVCASELRSERRVAYCSACGAQIQWSKEPVSQLRI
jgi:hypothetical protein